MHIRDPQGRGWDLSDPSQRANFFQTFGTDRSVWPEMYDMLHGLNGKGLGPLTNSFLEWFEQQNMLSKAEQTGDFTGFLGDMANNGYEMSPEMEKYIDDRINQQNVQTDQSYQTQMRDTSLLSSAEQLRQLGLSGSNVIQVGGAASGVSSQAASVNQHSAVATRQQARLNTYNQNMSMARSIIGMAGSMASSGIYGAALGATKNAAAKLAAATAHSGLNVLKHKADGSPKNGHWSKMDEQQWNQVMSDLGY